MRIIIRDFHRQIDMGVTSPDDSDKVEKDKLSSVVS